MIVLLGGCRVSAVMVEFGVGEIKFKGPFLVQGWTGPCERSSNVTSELGKHHLLISWERTPKWMVFVYTLAQVNDLQAVE